MNDFYISYISLSEGGMAIVTYFNTLIKILLFSLTCGGSKVLRSVCIRKKTQARMSAYAYVGVRCNAVTPVIDTFYRFAFCRLQKIHLTPNWFFSTVYRALKIVGVYPHKGQELIMANLPSVGEEWGSLKCTGILEADENYGGYSKSKTIVAVCECGKEIEIERDKWLGKSKVRDCGCGCYQRDAVSTVITLQVRMDLHSRIMQVAGDFSETKAQAVRRILETGLFHLLGE